MPDPGHLTLITVNLNSNWTTNLILILSLELQLNHQLDGMTNLDLEPPTGWADYDYDYDYSYGGQMDNTLHTSSPLQSSSQQLSSRFLPVLRAHQRVDQFRSPGTSQRPPQQFHTAVLTPPGNLVPSTFHFASCRITKLKLSYKNRDVFPLRVGLYTWCHCAYKKCLSPE